MKYSVKDNELNSYKSIMNAIDYYTELLVYSKQYSDMKYDNKITKSLLDKRDRYYKKLKKELLNQKKLINQLKRQYNTASVIELRKNINQTLLDRAKTVNKDEEETTTSFRSTLRPKSHEFQGPLLVSKKDDYDYDFNKDEHKDEDRDDDNDDEDDRDDEEDGRDDDDEPKEEIEVEVEEIGRDEDYESLSLLYTEACNIFINELLLMK
jgi:hypothetical protein